MSLLSNFPLQVIPSDFTAPSPLLSVPKKQQQSSNYAKPAKDILFIFPRSIATPSNTLLTSGVAEEGSSLQVDSLTIQTYLKFIQYTSLSCQVQVCYEPNASPTGTLPFMILSPSHDTSSSTSNSGDAHIQVDETKEEEEELVVGGKQAIVDAIRSKLDRKLKLGKKTDHDELSRFLIGDEPIDSDAFVALTESKIGAALTFSLWCEEDNYLNISKPLYESFHCFPINMILARQARSKANSELLHRFSSLDGEEIYKNAKLAMQALSDRLGKDDYFNGNQPSYLDAVVFAHLHSIMTLLNNPAANQELRLCCSLFDNLVEYSRRLHEAWYKL